MKRIVIMVSFFITIGCIITSCNVEEIQKQVDKQRNVIFEHFLVETNIQTYRIIMENHLDDMTCIRSGDEKGNHMDWYFSENSLPVIRKTIKLPEGPVYYLFVYDGEFIY